MTASVKRQVSGLALLVLFAAVFAVLSVLAQGGPSFQSVEIQVAEYSPAGPEGGSVIPASCPSFSHAGGDCNAEEGDMCFNLPGWQGSPEGNFLETPGVYRLCCTGGTVPIDAYTCGSPYAQSYYQGYYQGYYQSYYQGGYYSQSSYAPPAPTFSCSPSSINAGGSSTCTWSCGGSSTGSAGTNLSTGGALSGNVVVRPSDTTQYTVQCTPGGGSTSSTVTVNGMTLSISANPTRVRAGNASTITWSATQANSCTLSGPGLTTSCASAATCAAAHNNSTGALSTASRYTLTCSGASGTRSASVLVNIIPAQTEI